ncbi:MAG: hypothetical protein LC660_18125 [Desulfobacteraceae bacterium]|nr:hypothetical protein [Desulfobacteraceae bacterium]
MLISSKRSWTGFSYLRKIKDLFDPEDILNPNTLFNTAPITAHMDLDV